ncbi:unnamed protein product, partial [Amoebophrya sp. A120]
RQDEQSESNLTTSVGDEQSSPVSVEAAKPSVLLSAGAGRTNEVDQSIVHTLLCNMVRDQFLIKGGEAGKTTLKRITLAGLLADVDKSMISTSSTSPNADADAAPTAPDHQPHNHDFLGSPDDDVFQKIVPDGQTEDEFLYHFWCDKIKATLHAGELVKGRAD